MRSIAAARPHLFIYITMRSPGHHPTVCLLETAFDSALGNFGKITFSYNFVSNKRHTSNVLHLLLKFDLVVKATKALY